VLDVALRHPFQLRDEDVVRVEQEERHVRRGRDRVDTSPGTPILRRRECLRSPELHVDAMALVLPGELTHQGLDHLAALGWLAPDVDLSAPGSIGQPEGESTASEDDQLAPLKKASRVGYDARDLVRIDHERRFGNG
jgi:hypothetical protein